MYYCDECIAERSEGIADISLKQACKHAERVRTSMEVVGVDVFETVRKIGLPIEVIPCEGNVYGMITHSKLNSYGLLLVY